MNGSLSSIKVIACLFYFSIISSNSFAQAVDEEESDISKFIVESAEIIGGKDKIGVELNMDWNSNPEVAKVLGFEENKRLSIIDTTIEELAKNEKKLFPSISSANEATLFIYSRLLALEVINGFISKSNNDLILEDYLNGEMADLNMMLNGTFEYGNIYLQARKIRSDKKAMFLYQNKGFITEKLTLMTNNPNIANVLANKASLYSLVKVCTSVPRLCTKP
ncbi:MAG: hypothetical protein ACJAS1_006325 [Oleiphilaceae bacterium]|jgi:hypothetical protein